MILSTRALNRALLARQLLLERSPLSPKKALERLLGLQAQTPQSPYVALWSRLADFDPVAASALLTKKQAVRLNVMRGTMHLLTTADARTLRPLVQEKLTRSFASQPFGKAVKGMDLEALKAKVPAWLPSSLADLRPKLKAAFPGRDATAMSYAAYYLMPLVQLPPRGLWKGSGNPVLQTLETWTGKPMDAKPSLEKVLLRYLTAYGPASAVDAQAWSGLTKLDDVLRGMKLRTFTNEDGRTLYDVPRGALPHEDTPAPVRFLPDYDNATLGFADRRRIISEGDKQPFSQNGVIPGTVLVDGFAKASWKLVDGRVAVKPYGKLSPAHRAAVEEEAERLGAFLCAAHPSTGSG